MRIFHPYKKLMKDMGLGSLATMDNPTYPELSLEFLSTVNYKYLERFEHPSTAKLTFKIKDKLYSLTPDAVTAAYGLEGVNGEAVKFKHWTKKDEFWRLISSDFKYKSNEARTLKVRNPVIRYALKVLANTISARNSTNSVASLELCFLYRGLKKVLDQQEGTPWKNYLGRTEAHYGCIIGQSLLSYKRWALKAKATELFIGGWITPLLVYAGVDLEGAAKLQERAYLDLKYLITSHSLRAQPDERVFAHIFIRQDGKESICMLPNAKECNPNTISTIDFDPSNEECFAVVRFLNSEEGMNLHSRESRLPTQASQQPPSARQQDRTSHGPSEDFPMEYELPTLGFTPRSKNEKLMASMLEVQGRVNRWQASMIGKLMKKVKKLQPPDYLSSVEEQGDTAQGNEDGADSHPAGEESNVRVSNAPIPAATSSRQPEQAVPVQGVTIQGVQQPEQVQGTSVPANDKGKGSAVNKVYRRSNKRKKVPPTSSYTPY